MSRDATIFTIPPSALEGLSAKSKECIERLRLHQAHSVDMFVSPSLYAHQVLRPRKLRSAQPSSKLAAVLVLLYERAGDLRVLLTTRSKTLRSHPGQTALPGGKVDDTDDDVLSTAVSDSCATYRLDRGQRADRTQQLFTSLLMTT